MLFRSGVLVLPFDDNPSKKFKLPYFNGAFIIPIFWGLFTWQFFDRLKKAVFNFTTNEHQEYLFLIFIALATVLTLMTIAKKWSFIPVMGVLFCTYLMIEIPVKSWMVFFGWMALGLSIYFGYSFSRSKLGKQI